MNRIKLKYLIEIIVSEVISELNKRKINIVFEDYSPDNTLKKLPYEIDMKSYKTPVLTENTLNNIDKEISEIIIPDGTIITQGAKNIINNRRIKIIYKQTSKGDKNE